MKSVRRYNYKLVRLIRSNGYNQTTFANAIGIHPVTLSSMINGLKPFWRPSRYKIAKFFDRDEAWLFGRIKDQKPKKERTVKTFV